MVGVYSDRRSVAEGPKKKRQSSLVHKCIPKADVPERLKNGRGSTPLLQRKIEARFIPARGFLNFAGASAES
jgi:hypothetical protein